MPHSNQDNVRLAELRLGNTYKEIAEALEDFRDVDLKDKDLPDLIFGKDGKLTDAAYRALAERLSKLGISLNEHASIRNNPGVDAQLMEQVVSLLQSLHSYADGSYKFNQASEGQFWLDLNKVVKPCKELSQTLIGASESERGRPEATHGEG